MSAGVVVALVWVIVAIWPTRGELAEWRNRRK